MRYLMILALLCSSLLAQDIQESFPLGTNLKFVATANGKPEPTFEWFLNGTKIAEGAEYNITSLVAAQAGTYTAKATNALGTATSNNYILSIGEPPTKVNVKVTVVISVQTETSVPGSSTTRSNNTKK